MKKSFFYTITVIALLTVAGCKGFCQSVMTMTTAPKTQEVKISFIDSDTATIDWGDGESDIYIPSGNYVPSIRHTYFDTSAHTITITGNSVEVMFCRDNQLVSLDVSKNTKLKRLFCSNNQLTSLDVSKNIELKSLQCDNNQFSETELNALFHTLCYHSGYNGNIIIYGNLGTGKCDKSIAEKKGWKVIIK